ncbi:MAG TPA: UbiA-like polyprenyltransferase [Pirellulaceae bacterium]|nr:UbiA-like polyprenyltransferase [Pirellulaceae bacterium]HMO92626.1 UbiA-like polyprenyltransferase [Pirellulaceae bacterium]HMP70226.1 UbiA-like polyprenyltransferase [Pirellulaceae bacterium]
MSLFTKTRDLLEMIRFSHTVFALPFALLAAVMAWTSPGIRHDQIAFNPWHLVGILICMVGARSAAMAFNRLVDRQIDTHNPRTAQRHLPAGKLSVTSVVLFLLITTAIFISGTLLFLPNWLPLALAIPVLIILLGYSYTKRFTSLAHFWLGLSLMLAPIAVWIALRGEFVLDEPKDLVPAIVLGLAVMLWVAGFDMIYACQDYEFDRGAGLRSIPATFGVAASLRIAAICHLMMVVMLIALPFASRSVGIELNLGWLYWLAVTFVAILLTYEHALVRPNDLTRVNQAFFNVNAIVSFVLFILGSIDLIWN